MASPSAQFARDLALVQRLNADDETALAELMRDHFDAVADIAFHYVRSVDAARDIAQTVFIRLWEHRRTLRLTGNVIHYLRRSARNAALDALDRDAAAARLAATVALDCTLVPLRDEGDRMRELEARELTEAVQRATRLLPPRVREVTALYLEQGLEPGEIAHLLGTAPRTVYNQLRRAMRELAAALADWKNPPK